MPGIEVFVNPYAGGNKLGRTRAERLADIVRDHGEVHCPTTLEELDDELSRALDRRPDVVALCGGDGSYFRAFTILDKRLGSDPWPLILPLPGGTVNNLTHAIRSQSRSPERLLSHVVADLHYGIAHDCADCDLFKVGDDAVGYIFGAGMIVNFLRAYYAPGDPNPLSAAWLVMRLMGSAIIRGPLQAKIFQPFEADVIVDHERVPHRSYRLMIASSVAAIGLGFEPFYLAGRKPGQFHILGGPAKATRLTKRLRYFYHGYPSRDTDLYDNLGAEMTVEFARPAYYTVNGDLLGPVMRVAVRKLRRISVIRG